MKIYSLHRGRKILNDFQQVNKQTKNITALGNQFNLLRLPCLLEIIGSEFQS